MNREKNPFQDVSELQAELIISQDGGPLELRTELRLNEAEIFEGGHQFLVTLKRVFLSVDPQGLTEVKGSRHNDGVQRTASISHDAPVSTRTRESKIDVKGGVLLSPKLSANKVNMNASYKRNKSKEVRVAPVNKKSELAQIVTSVAGKKWQIQKPDSSALNGKFLSHEDVLCCYKPTPKSNLSALTARVLVRPADITCTELKQGHPKRRLFALENRNKDKLLGVMVAKSMREISAGAPTSAGGNTPTYIVLSEAELTHEDNGIS